MPTRSSTLPGLAVAALVFLSPGPARAQGVLPPPPGGCVITVDGSGCLCDISRGLKQAVAECGLPLAVEPYIWTHGTGRVFADLCSHGHQRDKGRELAALICARRQACPGGKLYLVCHSSGAAVGLAAAACLPPGSVDRIILLAPAVSCRYDLRPALRCACEGVDVFYSRKDVISYALVLTGTTDGYHQFSAGCQGFTVPGCAADQALYANLRQHAWEKGMCGAGHYGGHFGCAGNTFMKTYVVPLLSSCH